MVNFYLILLLLVSFNDALLKNLQWRNIGPAIMGGRIDDFAVVESNPDIIYVGAATGGLWKSTNGGTTWVPILDDFGTTSIGDVAVAPSNPNLVWVGTGEANNRQSSSWGNGVYKSTDGGKTWTRMGLEDSHHIGRVVIDPKNPDIVYVAALGHLWGPNKERGLYKTTDGGRTWTNTKFIDENTGFVDVVMDPSDSNTLYAAAYQRQRKAYGFNGGGPGSGIYKTTDAGKTWTRLTEGLPTGDIGRIGLDIYRKNPAVLYATVENKEGGVFRSDDRGKTWRKVNPLNPRPLYFSQIRIDPQDDRRIYVLGGPLFVSDDGGKTFRSDGARNVHVDHHALWIDPKNPNFLILGNDGGVWFSKDRSQTWTRINNIPLGQFYGLTYDMQDPYYLYGGLQDNAVWGGPSATRHRVGPLNDDWFQIGGGDGMIIAADPLDPNTVYVETQEGRIVRFDRSSGELKAVRPVESPASGPESEEKQEGPPPHRFNWTTPLLISPHNPRTIYLAGNKVWKSLDRGERWFAISLDLTKQMDRDKIPIMGGLPGENMLGRNDGIASYGNATAMAESPIQPGFIVVGTDDGNVQMTKDSGVNWTNLTSRFAGLPENTWVSRVELSRFDVRRLLVTFDGHRNDDYTPYVYVSNDGGDTFQSIARGLPRVPARTIKEDLRNPNLLFLGTENAVWVSNDRGGSWTRLKNGLPDVPVYDIQIHPRNRDLILGTHGRSIYIMNIAPLQELTEQVLATSVHLFNPLAATMFNSLEHRDFLGQATYAGANPAYGANLAYFLSESTPDVQITIQDREGRLVRELQGGGDAGINRVVWDLRLPSPPQPPRQTPEGVDPADPRPAESTLARIPGDFGGGGDPTGGEAGSPPEPTRGPPVLPGEYVVKLSARGQEKSALLVIKGDPRVEISDEDRRRRHQFLLDMYEVQKYANPAATAAHDLNTQMAATSKALGRIKDLLAEIKKSNEDTSKQVKDLQGKIGRTVGTVNTLGREVSGSTSPPTEAQYAQLANTTEQLKTLIPQLDELLTKTIPAFNSQLDQSSVPAAVPRLKPASRR